MLCSKILSNAKYLVLLSVICYIQAVQLKNMAETTVDTWLVWKLTNRKLHISDVTNACHTMLYNIRTMSWDEDLLKLFGVPSLMLPEVHSSSEIYGKTATTVFAPNVPIGGIIGDQQAALFGHKSFAPGKLKTTYETECFLMMNIGKEVVDSANNLISSIAWKIGDEVTYALEGSVFVGGAVVAQ